MKYFFDPNMWYRLSTISGSATHTGTYTTFLVSKNLLNHGLWHTGYLLTCASKPAALDQRMTAFDLSYYSERLGYVRKMNSWCFGLCATDQGFSHLMQEGLPQIKIAAMELSKFLRSSG